LVKAIEGNLLVGQSGGPTPVINASLAGVISEAQRHSNVKTIYGMENGIEGLLQGKLKKIPEMSEKNIQLLASTPASALGSCRYKVQDDDYPKLLQIFKENNIRYFFYIGGNDSMDTCNKIAKLAEAEGYEMYVMGVPKTIDNDLPLTDHCPGFGSAARFTAVSTLGTGRDLEAMKTFDDVTIVEIMGRHAGWLAASSALLKRDVKDAPHLIYLPERTFKMDKFIEDVKTVHKELGYVFVAIGEGIRDESGEFIGAKNAVKDAFGHIAIALSEGPAAYLARTVNKELGLQARYNRSGTIQRAYSESVSDADRNEAFMVGQKAVELAVKGETGKMVTLVRGEGTEYKCTTGTASLEKVANVEKVVPDEFINAEGNFVTEAFKEYALPLLGSNLPEYYRFK
jgi:6-phosphofructokinase 1